MSEKSATVRRNSKRTNDQPATRESRLKFTHRWVTAVQRTGNFYDVAAPGLMLQVTAGKSGLCKSYKFLFRSPVDGRRRDKGLGPVSRTSLQDARRYAITCREMIGRGIDPLTAAADEKAARLHKQATSITLAEAVTRCVEAKAPEWRNKKHRQQWENTIRNHARSLLNLPVRDIDSAAVLSVLQPIWTSKPETASRVRQRIETVLDWATAGKYRSGDNPARLKGNLGPLLPKTSKVKRIRHHPALPISQINAFVSALHERPSVSALALEFLILTASRTSEVRLATWAEVDFDTRVWTIPPERMKSGRQHRVPLSNRAITILEIQRELPSRVFVFPGQRVGEEIGLSAGAMLQLIRGMSEYHAYVPHGFRSTFRDWASEYTSFANESVELALAHTIKNQTESSYRRGDQLEKRRNIMQAWATFVETAWSIKSASIVPMASRGVR